MLPVEVNNGLSTTSPTLVVACFFFFWVTHFNRYAEDTLGWCVIGISFSNFDQSSHPDILGRMASEVCRGSCLFPVCRDGHKPQVHWGRPAAWILGDGTCICRGWSQERSVGSHLEFASTGA